MSSNLLAEAYPLAWPTATPRTSSQGRRDGQFQVGFAKARDDLLKELGLIGARNVVLSTNVPLRRDGLPYAGMAEPLDPGVAVHFERKQGPFVIACDSYTKVRANLRAVGATVEALRSIQRHGASSMLEQAFTGFAALPPKRDEMHWWETLGLPADASSDDIRSRYREMAKAYHPDSGGDPARMVEINQAYALALTSPIMETPP